MTRQQFQTKYHENLKDFINSPCGQGLLVALGTLRPAYEFSQQECLFAENRGAIRGYELAIRTMIGLSIPPVMVKEPEINYGVVENNQPSEK